MSEPAVQRIYYCTYCTEPNIIEDEEYQQLRAERDALRAVTDAARAVIAWQDSARTALHEAEPDTHIPREPKPFLDLRNALAALGETDTRP